MDLCELCVGPGGEIVWQSGKLRVVRVADPDYPGFCRVIWRDHVREMTDLASDDARALLDVVLTTEKVVRHLFQPDKINLASFGNVVPHLHWHIIPRWQGDRHFPQPIWGTPQSAGPWQRPQVPNATLAAALAASLGPSQTIPD